MVVKYGGDGSVKEVLEDRTAKVVRLPNKVRRGARWEALHWLRVVATCCCLQIVKVN